MIRVYRHYPNGAAQEILSYEAKGMGDYDFNAKNQDGTPNYPLLESGYRGRPLTGGGCAYLAYSPKDGYQNVLGDGGFEGAIHQRRHQQLLESGNFIAVMERSYGSIYAAGNTTLLKRSGSLHSRFARIWRHFTQAMRIEISSVAARFGRPAI